MQVRRLGGFRAKRHQFQENQTGQRIHSGHAIAQTATRRLLVQLFLLQRLLRKVPAAPTKSDTPIAIAQIDMFMGRMMSEGGHTATDAYNPSNSKRVGGNACVEGTDRTT